jgi:hypothetical protein
MLDTGCWILDAGYWMLDAGYWMLDTGCWILDAGLIMAGMFMGQFDKNGKMATLWGQVKARD